MTDAKLRDLISNIITRSMPHEDVGGTMVQYIGPRRGMDGDGPHPEDWDFLWTSLAVKAREMTVLCKAVGIDLARHAKDQAPRKAKAKGAK